MNANSEIVISFMILDSIFKLTNKNKSLNIVSNFTSRSYYLLLLSLSFLL